MAKVLDSWALADRLQSQSVAIDLEANKKYAIKFEYFEGIRDAEVRLSWRMPGAKPTAEEALEIAQAADVIVFVGGLTGDVEGEEMKVIYPGFAGGDPHRYSPPTNSASNVVKTPCYRQADCIGIDRGLALAVDLA